MDRQVYVKSNKRMKVINNESISWKKWRWGSEVLLSLPGNRYRCNCEWSLNRTIANYM